MTDTVDTDILVSTASHYTVRLTNESDGTGEAAVAKIDKSGLTGLHGREPLAIDILTVQYIVTGFNYVVLFWDHGTDAQIVVLQGTGFIDFRDYGGLRDTSINDGSGDVLLTTDGGADGSGYNIVIETRLRGDD
jgi:hypothetical protein